jgi:hypothetical protein
MVVHACNPSCQKAETGGSRVGDQPGLHSKVLSQKRKQKKSKQKKDQLDFFAYIQVGRQKINKHMNLKSDLIESS